MTQARSSRERAEHIYQVTTSGRFLSMGGLNNEVPFFICPHSATEAFEMDQDRRRIVSRASKVGVDILDLSLYDLALDLLRNRGILDEILEAEEATDKSELKELLQACLDPADHLVPAIAASMRESQHDVVFLSGVGEVYPFIRSHNVLNNLQSVAKDRPTVLFFPGTYTHALATGASLDLFGLLHDDKYYRAFDILNYEV